MTTPTRLRLSSMTDVACALPYLVGFFPHDSLVALGLGAPEGTWVARLDLSAAPFNLTALADHATRVRPEKLILAGFGTADRVNTIVAVVSELLADRDVPVFEALRVHDGRWWSLTDAEAPVGGTAYDATCSPVAAQAVAAGMGVLPSRAALEQTLEPVDSAAMRQASVRAERRLTAALTAGEPATEVASRLVDEGTDLLASVVEAFSGGQIPDEDTIALLGVLLTCRYIRDQAIKLIDAGPELPHAQVRLWTEMARRIIEPYAAAPTCLLAYAAWRCGDGTLANIAVDRVLHHHPDYTMAQLLNELLASGLSPQQVPPLTDADLDGALQEALPVITREFQLLNERIRRWHRLAGAPERPAASADSADSPSI